jgi:hypothetical protein
MGLMLVLNGVFKNNAFISDRELSIPDGTKAVVSVEDTSPVPAEEIKRQKKAWHTFFEEIRAIDEALPPAFDEILAKGVQFNKIDFS